MILEIKRVENLLVFEENDGTGVVWMCWLKTDAPQAPKWRMVEETWLKNAWDGCNPDLPCEEVKENRAGKWLHSQWKRLAMSSRMMVCDVAKSQGSCALKLSCRISIWRKCVFWEQSEFLFEWRLLLGLEWQKICLYTSV